MEFEEMEEDTKRIISQIEKEYNRICNQINTNNALDFIQEIKDYLMETYRID